MEQKRFKVFDEYLTYLYPRGKKFIQDCKKHGVLNSVFRKERIRFDAFLKRLEIAETIPAFYKPGYIV